MLFFPPDGRGAGVCWYRNDDACAGVDGDDGDAGRD
jgi:hypothetical protein